MLTIALRHLHERRITIVPKIVRVQERGVNIMKGLSTLLSRLCCPPRAIPFHS